jgi:hypothetical protein
VQFWPSFLTRILGLSSKKTLKPGEGFDVLAAADPSHEITVVSKTAKHKPKIYHPQAGNDFENGSSP